MLNSDYKEMLQCLLGHRVRFLLVDVEKLTTTKRDGQ